MMHSSIKRALLKKQQRDQEAAKMSTSSTNQAPQRYLPRLELSKIGQVEPVCPQCLKQLETMPEQTDHCPHCDQEIIVMTRPADKATVLVNEKEAAKLEKEWEAYNERRDPYLRDKGAHAINIAYAELWDTWGREPTLSEIKKLLLEKDEKLK